ncbi:heptaprenyl diphosphate synthase component 1 [Heyndrickxia oleronia]|uniref:heptaprenyl diphosphate synthase component 1 n=1 Tax=Heyndrickxia oleronia TaxID=38875 RepID=UPI00203A44E2|nr:heptaprenyl diphosphate synthase component 1 [Heyndrickxia oleronia]MCM3236824.1 heptaprenyl diphosphate synthase component 1 [Heyndrickxia oleronia]
MDLQERMQQIALIKETIKQKISQNYLMQFIDEPYIDEDRMNILIESLSNMKLSKGNINKYVTTTMLIQIALDTHDKVNNTSELLKKRQLTVLAGDYYSGLYYKILAEVENVPLIRTLAEGIKIVNEHKVAIYRLEDCTVEQYMDTLKKVESTIISKFINFFGSKELSILGEELLFLITISNEIEKVKKEKHSILFEALTKLLLPTNLNTFQQLSSENKCYLIEKCQPFMDQAIEKIVMVKEKLNLNQLLDQRIHFLLKQHSREKLFLEEG